MNNMLRTWVENIRNNNVNQVVELYHDNGLLLGTFSNIERYVKELITNYRLWQDYRFLNKIAIAKGIKIYNSTNGGYLDVFKRYDFNKIDR